MDAIRTIGRHLLRIGGVQFLWGNPHVAAIFEALGVPPNRGYFALRAAPMGRPVPILVGNAFAFFPPPMVAKIVARTWEVHGPGEIVDLAVPHLAEAARSVFGDADAVAELAELYGAATAAARCEGRMLATAWSTVTWPDHAPARLLGAASVLREHRGDGHILALQRHGLSPLEGTVLGTARRGKDVTAAATSRGWRDEEIAGALRRLAERGAVVEGRITDEGTALWEAAERLTDELAAQPWEGIDLDRVVALGEEVIAAGRWSPLPGS